MVAAISSCAPSLDRRSAGRESMGRLLVARQEMLVLFCRVAGLDPFPRNPKVQEVLQKFCQVLVDYMATAHFSLYERIINGVERRQAAIAVARELYPRIEACTETAIVFNDKYDCADQCQDIAHLHDDLSELGEALATRIELEDRLIKEILGD
ncbi:MAG TPA: Rsd/AlgQ family anti-sigma factor [Acidiferrobacter sp.]|nr:Rsd/AlgQ family anti-sigma factor [Acidiferrobacter sp.]